MFVGEAPVSMILTAWIGLLLTFLLGGVVLLVLLAEFLGWGPFAM